MHLIHDENGNVCPHSHEHTHTHQHTYEHSHSHSHAHGHEEEHAHTHDAAGTSCEQGCSGCSAGHTHAHGHDHGAADGSEPDKMTALLDYMLKHNEHHAAELDQVADKLRETGKAGAAEQIKKAVDEFQKGNLYLSLALSMVRDAN